MAFEEDLIEIETPERVELSFPIAGLGSRFAAAIIDLLAIIGLNTVLSIFWLLIILPVFSESEYLESMAMGAMYILYFLINFGYYIFFEYRWNGQTPGKRVMKLRVMRYGGLPINFASAMTRNLMRIVDIFLFGITIGFFMLFLSKHSQRAGDYAAGTLVVRDGNVTLEDLDRYLQKSETKKATDSSVDKRFNKLSAEDAKLIEAFVYRRREMDIPQRREMGRRIASNIRKKLGLKPDDYETNEILIRTAFQALRDREGNW